MSDQTTIESLEDAIEKNRNIQEAVKEQLQRLATLKAENRAKASKLLTVIRTDHERADRSRVPPPVENPTSYMIEKVVQYQKGLREGKERESRIRKRAKANWKYDATRRWKRRFFQDLHESIPEPNEDTNKRRTWEQDRPFAGIKCTPWSKSEIQNLHRLIKKQEDAAESRSANSSIDYEKISTELRKACDGNGKKGDEINERVCRTPEQCQLQHMAQQAEAGPLTKAELDSLKHQAEASKAANDGQIGWDDIRLPNRSRWQIFSAHQSRVYSPLEATFTPEEDELLLKHIATLGPQQFMDTAQAAHISSTLLPNKHTRAILSRANQSVLDPNKNTGFWPPAEERKVALAMKLYSDRDHPLTSASVHFERATKSVSDKWTRTVRLNPKFANKVGYSSEEKQLAMEAETLDDLKDLSERLCRPVEALRSARKRFLEDANESGDDAQEESDSQQ